MYNITHIDDLVTVYNITDRKGNFIKALQVVAYEDLLEAIGEWKENESLSEYMGRSVNTLIGLEDIHADNVLWYSVSDPESAKLVTIFEDAIANNIDIIVIEIKDPVDENGMFIQNKLLE